MHHSADNAATSRVPVNSFKRALLAGDGRQVGFWISMASPISAEIVARAGFDWVLIDMEHSPADIGDVASMLRACAGTGAAPVVRPPANDPIIIKRLLDLGVQTLLVPFVETAEQAQAAVAASRYPPRGMRGFSATTRANNWGRIADYAALAEREICVIVQLETQRALSAIEDIAALEGVDAIFIGAADMAADMGLVGQQSSEEVQDVVLQAGQRIMAAGKPACLLTSKAAEIDAALSAGFRAVAVGSDAGVLSSQTRAIADRYRRGDAATPA